MMTEKLSKGVEEQVEAGDGKKYKDQFVDLD